MLPHQIRVVEEKKELDGKIDKLSAFKGATLFSQLDEAEQERLVRQLSCMGEYSEILQERINAF
jgi:hypothetical protein